MYLPKNGKKPTARVRLSTQGIWCTTNTWLHYKHLKESFQGFQNYSFASGSSFLRSVYGHLNVIQCHQRKGHQKQKHSESLQKSGVSGLPVGSRNGLSWSIVPLRIVSASERFIQKMTLFLAGRLRSLCG